MTAEVHFVQAGDAPVLVGAGDGTLDCACGNTLIQSFQPRQFLAVGIRCGRCGAVTTTALLPEGRMPPAGLSAAEPSAEPRVRAMKVPAGVAVVGRMEMERLGSLLRPVTPDTRYVVSSSLLDQAADAFRRLTGGALPDIAPDPSAAVAGPRRHALGWAVGHLRVRVQEDSWNCLEDPLTAHAVAQVIGFLHFEATWSRHPLFPAMAATAGDRGFSVHGLALYAGAHCLAMMGNRVGFQEPAGFPAHIETFNLATSTTDVVRVRLRIFDRFEFPFGQPWDPAGLRGAVSDAVEAAQSQINRRNPGLLLLSPGAASQAYDEALVEAVKGAVQEHGRKNRGLMAVAPIVLRLQALPEPHTVRLGYGLFPIANRHFSSEGAGPTSGF